MAQRIAQLHGAALHLSQGTDGEGLRAEVHVPFSPTPV
jgi:hypothetical protein